ncbi:MAG TPA: DUF99 family protein [Planctomycetota bacterium]|nr:DUF99 family protein [Planctomycetota bacterium]
MARRQHTLSIDDGPFEKRRDREVWAVGVVTAGSGLVEGVLTTRLAVDSGGVTDRLALWVNGSRFRPSLRAVFIQGITIAGLSVVDLPLFHRLTGLPVISVDRKAPVSGRLEETLRKLGLGDRIAALEAAGPFHEITGLVFTCAGASPEEARRLIGENRGRSRLPEGIRIAHLIARAITLGESRGRA